MYRKNTSFWGHSKQKCMIIYQQMVIFCHALQKITTPFLLTPTAGIGIFFGLQLRESSPLPAGEVQ